jgi:hypothetical protein
VQVAAASAELRRIPPEMERIFQNVLCSSGPAKLLADCRFARMRRGQPQAGVSEADTVWEKPAAAPVILQEIAAGHLLRIEHLKQATKTKRPLGRSSGRF